jgi:hypothetical protein
VLASTVASRLHSHIRFGVEDVTADSFRNGHAKIDKKTDSRDADSSIVLVRTRQESCVVMMVMAMVLELVPAKGDGDEDGRVGMR